MSFTTAKLNPGYNNETQRSIGESIAVTNPKIEQWLSLIPVVNVPMASRTEWTSIGAHLYRTTYTSHTGSGTSSIVLTVADSTPFVAYDLINIQGQGAVPAQNVYATAVDTTLNTVTVSTFDGEDFVTPAAAGVLVSRIGVYRGYGTDQSMKVEESSLYYNYLQQFQSLLQISAAEAGSYYAEGTPKLDVIKNKLYADLKNKIARSGMVGQANDPGTGATGVALCQGIASFIAENSGNFDIGTVSGSSIDNLIEWIEGISDSNGLAGYENLLIVDKQMSTYLSLYAASKNGGALKIWDTQAPISRISLDGVDFIYVKSQSLQYFNSGGTALAITLRDDTNQSLINMRYGVDKAVRKYKDENTSEYWGAVTHAAPQIEAPHYHGIFAAGYTGSGYDTDLD